MNQMMMRTVLTLALATLVSATALGSGKGKIGDRPPTLRNVKWLQGDPVEVARARDDRVYLVEFWGTYCGPCRRSIPKLNALAQKYEDELVVIGVAIEPESKVAPFVKEQGEKMQYAVAIDPSLQTYWSYMRPCEASGVPHAFIVKNGHIYAHGNPSGGRFRKLIEQVVLDEFDLERAMAAQKAKVIGERYIKAVAKGRISNQQALRQLGEKFINDADNQTDLLHGWAAHLVNELSQRRGYDPELTAMAAKQACELSEWEESAYIATYANTLAVWDKPDEAIAALEKAIAAAEDEEYEQALVKALESYRASLSEEEPPTDAAATDATID